MTTLKNEGLSRNERIKSRKDFEQIFLSGKTVYSTDKKIKAIYLVSPMPGKPGVKIAPAVSSRAGIAVWRNRVKRLIKESYRLNKETLTELSLQKNIAIKIVFSPNLLNEKNNRIVKLKDIMPGVIEVMLKIKSNL